MSDIFERAMEEIEDLENDLEVATTDKRKKEITNAIHDIERDLRDIGKREEIANDEILY